MNVLLFRDLTTEQVDQLRREFPQCAFRQTTKREELAAESDWAEVIFGNPAADLVARAPRLRWLQIVSSGFDEYGALQGMPVTVTTAHGVHAPIIAQHALAMLLWFARGQPLLAQSQRTHVWHRQPRIPQDIARQTIGLVGFGEVGRALARFLRPLGPRVVAVKRRPAPRPPELDALSTFDQLDEVLAASDQVVIALPLTPQTRGLFDADRLARFRPGAILHNVARGGLVDEAALLACLRDGSLGGAALDVFAREPLPGDSPFWDLPNVVITPHLAGHHRDLGAAALERFRQNLQRYCAGQPLEHVADFAGGY